MPGIVYYLVLPLHSMKKTGQTEGVKGKVLSGFFLLLVLALIAILAVIQLARQLSPPESGVSDSVIKLTLVSNMLSELLEANGQARAYINTGEKRYLYRYRKLDKDIQQLADSLKYFSTSQPEQYRRMLSVDSLLKLKRITMENFFRIRRADDTLAMNLTGKKLSRADSATARRAQEKTSISRQPSQENNGEESKQGFFKKIWDNFSGRKTRKDTVQGSLPQINLLRDTLNALTSAGDTTIEMVKSQLHQMSEQERIYKQRIIDRDLLLLRTDQVIMDEIRNVFILFEKEEINRAVEESSHGREVFRRLWYTALVLAAVGLFTMLVFVILIWKDLARSNFYRRQLETARHLAEKLLKVKELFLANMSHEIRTPITSIIGFTERLSTTRLTKEQAAYLKYINSSSEHLLGLVDDLLDYSRIESGKLNLDSIGFIPSEMFQHAFETLRHKADLKGLQMNYRSEIPEDLTVSGDPLRIRQIVYNLLNNSIKFTESGSISLVVSSQKTDDKVKLGFVVSDTGIGIPPEKQKEIFGEFTQVDESITRKYGGSGLGLAICRKLVSLMNGEIELESTPGEGTRVTVSILVEQYDGPVPEHMQEMSGSTIDLRGFKILLAEDDEPTRILISELLRSAGAELVVAADGLEAWNLIQKDFSSFNLIITDIQMPNLSGPELAGRITRHAETAVIEVPPVLGLTAHATRDEIESYHRTGIRSVLIKPFRVHQLVGTLAKMLNAAVIVPAPDSNDIKGATMNINLEPFRKFSGNDNAALNRILHSLADNLGATAKEMNTAALSGDLQLLALLAHRMLPNIRNLGAADVAGLLQKLESLRHGNSLDPDELTTIMQTLTKSLKALETELRNQVTDY